MPGGDRTGPMGRGPMTGRGVGYCRGFGAPAYENPALGQGFRRRSGFGGGGGRRGWRHRFYATGLSGWRSGWWGGPPYFAAPTPAAEREYLEEVAESLQGQLGDIKKRLEELSARHPEKAE
jgi:hypothetical protein